MINPTKVSQAYIALREEMRREARGRLLSLYPLPLPEFRTDHTRECTCLECVHARLVALRIVP